MIFERQHPHLVDVNVPEGERRSAVDRLSGRGRRHFAHVTDIWRFDYFGVARLGLRQIIWVEISVRALIGRPLRSSRLRGSPERDYVLESADSQRSNKKRAEKGPFRSVLSSNNESE